MLNPEEYLSWDDLVDINRRNLEESLKLDTNMEPVKLTPEQWLVLDNLDTAQDSLHNIDILCDLKDLGLVESYTMEDESGWWTETHIPAECKLECLEWRREPNNKLFLYVFENKGWVRYTQAQHYKPDWQRSTNSGFATAQKYLSLGFTYKVTK